LFYIRSTQVPPSVVLIWSQAYAPLYVLCHVLCTQSYANYLCLPRWNQKFPRFFLTCVIMPQSRKNSSRTSNICVAPWSVLKCDPLNLTAVRERLAPFYLNSTPCFGPPWQFTSKHIQTFSVSFRGSSVFILSLFINGCLVSQSWCTGHLITELAPACEIAVAVKK
jgi:hypothetical protein